MVIHWLNFVLGAVVLVLYDYTLCIQQRTKAFMSAFKTCPDHLSCTLGALIVAIVMCKPEGVWQLRV